MRKVVLLFSVVFCSSLFAFYLVKTELSKEEQQARYCQERTRLGMHIYDSIRDGKMLSEVTVPWKTEAPSPLVALYRKAWLEYLKAEVDYLILKGYLSMRVKERLYQQCLESEGQEWTLPELHEINV